jgi:hypothetical protein
MSSKVFETTAARLRRLTQAVAELEHQIKKSSPEAAMRLRVKLRDLREGLRLTQLSKA